MEDTERSLRTVFTKNRAEEWGYDVWDHFVVPPFYNRLDLAESRKSRIIIGGRGCGKTMLLRYLSHQSVFSPKRYSIPDEAFSHIGLYWRVDTSSVVLMNERDLPPDVWHSAFEHLVALTVGLEIIESTHSIVNSKATFPERNNVNNINFSQLAVFDSSFDVSFPNIRGVFRKKLSEFRLWVSNVRKHSEPNFFPGREFLLSVISDIQDRVPTLSKGIYYVYIDEFESLLEYQQRIINTLIKQSEVPLIFNVARKRHGFLTKETIGKESIANIADYREHDLEQYLSEGDFDLFAAEVLCLNLSSSGFEQIPIDPQILHKPESLQERSDDSYRNAILSYIRNIFPSISEDKLALGIFEDDTLRNRLRKDIKETLEKRRSKIPFERFCRSHLPQASVITPALLNRSTLEPEEIIKELDLLEGGKDNLFTGTTDWIHNNFIGCLLKIYGSYPRACPFYAGFDTFCKLARGNLRHFLELCHKSINQGLRRTENGKFPVTLDEQAIAARQASMEFLADVRSFGQSGNQLYTFVLGLGSLFALAHRQPTQSEPERSHFSMRGDFPVIGEFDSFLKEAKKWSVLFEERETKQKDSDQPESLEYILNPIYSPYFHISYRKRRRLELTSDDFSILIKGDYNNIKELLKKRSRLWSVELRDTDPNLFSHLLEEND